VIVEIMRHIPNLSFEVPEAILVLITNLDEIYAFCLVDDTIFLFVTYLWSTGLYFDFSENIYCMAGVWSRVNANC